MSEVFVADPLSSLVIEPGALYAGLIGRGIQESRSPRMHEAEGARLGLRYAYKLFDFDRLQLEDAALPDLLLAVERLGFAGLNITHPFKERVISFLDELAPDAASIGAVNTVVLRHGKRVGYNTDCWGFAESFRRDMAGADLAAVVLLGAGGAGRAVARALMELGAERLAIFDRAPNKAAALAGALSSAFGANHVQATSDLATDVLRARGLVNATPVGMAKYPGLPVPSRWLREDLWVADIIYFPAETELLKLAQVRGSRTLAGAGMAIFQAVKAFELITAVAPDPAAMARHFEALQSAS